MEAGIYEGTRQRATLIETVSLIATPHLGSRLSDYTMDDRHDNYYVVAINEFCETPNIQILVEVNEEDYEDSND